ASPRARIRSARRALGAWGCQRGAGARGRRLVHRAGGRERGFAERGQRVQPTAGTILARGNRRILPAAGEQLHFFEARERAIQRAVRREEAAVARVADVFRDFVAVEFDRRSTAEVGGRLADRELDREERSWFSSHAPIIG